MRNIREIRPIRSVRSHFPTADSRPLNKWRYNMFPRHSRNKIISQLVMFLAEFADVGYDKLYSAIMDTMMDCYMASFGNSDTTPLAEFDLARRDAVVDALHKLRSAIESTPGNVREGFNKSLLRAALGENDRFLLGLAPSIELVSLYAGLVPNHVLERINFDRKVLPRTNIVNFDAPMPRTQPRRHLRVVEPNAA